jgi:hypothetical protein
LYTYLFSATPFFSNHETLSLSLSHTDSSAKTVNMRFTTTIASLLTVGMAAALSRRACAAQKYVFTYLLLLLLLLLS